LISLINHLPSGQAVRHGLPLVRRSVRTRERPLLRGSRHWEAEKVSIRGDSHRDTTLAAQKV